jgi:hypothetical protein
MVEEMTKQLEMNIIVGSTREQTVDIQGSEDRADDRDEREVPSSEQPSASRDTDGILAIPESERIGTDPRKRIFFPANREDALLLLGGLCISEYFSTPDIALAVNDNGIAVIEQGLRATEASLLERGQKRNFPLLIELHDWGGYHEPATILPHEISAIWFRSRSECDEFRFRSVDEFDANTYRCDVDSELFGLQGVSRFGLRAGSAFAELGKLADKLSDGVISILDLANRQPSCREAVCMFFRGTQVGEASSGLDFATAINAALQSGETSTNDNPIRTAVVSAFLSAVDSSPRSLLEQIGLLIAEQSPVSGNTPDPVSRWLEFSDTVVRNQIALTGDRLSDEKSVLLRAALLGLMVDEIDALETFLNAEKPSGYRVTTIAAFLVGLKRGIVSNPWEQKRRFIDSAPYLISEFLQAIVRNPRSLTEVMSVTRREVANGHELSIMCSQRSLATWEVENIFELNESEIILASALGMDSSSSVTHSPHSHGFCIKTSTGRVLEVSAQSKGSNCISLRYYLGSDQKFRKAKDLLEYGSAGGRVWYPARDEEGQDFLYCDLVSAPDNEGRQVLMDALDAALGHLLIPRKVAKARKKRGA